MRARLVPVPILSAAALVSATAALGAAPSAMEADRSAKEDVRLLAKPNPVEVGDRDDSSRRVSSRVEVVDRRTGRHWKWGASTMRTRNWRPWSGRRILNTSANSSTAAWVEQSRSYGGALTFSVWTRRLLSSAGGPKLVMRRTLATAPKLSSDCPGYNEECPIWGADVAILEDGTVAWVIQGVRERVMVKRPRESPKPATTASGEAVAALGADDGRMLWWTTTDNGIQFRDSIEPRVKDGCPVRSRFRAQFTGGDIRSYEGFFIEGAESGLSQYMTLVCDPRSGSEFRLPGGRGWLGAVSGTKALVLDFYPGSGGYGCDTSYARALDLGTRRATARAETGADFFERGKRVWRASVSLREAGPSNCDPQYAKPKAFVVTPGGRAAWVVQISSDEGPAVYDGLFTIEGKKIIPLAYADMIDRLASDGEKFTWTESGVAGTG